MILRNIAVVATLSLAFAAGCKKPANETSDTRTTSAMQQNEAARGATPSSPNAPNEMAGTTGVTGATATATTLATGDVDFMKKAAMGGLFEVKMGQQAAGRATRPDVKSFANHMVTDHGKLNAELKDLAGKKNVVIPTALDDDHTKKMNDILKESGAQFDEKYMKEMLEGHESTVKDFQKAAVDAKDADLRTWATNTLPMLSSHLAMARDIEGKKGAVSTPTPRH
jgi:putative membrane protein